MSLMNHVERKVYKERMLRAENVVSDQVYMLPNCGMKPSEQELLEKFSKTKMSLYAKKFTTKSPPPGSYLYS